MKLDFNDPNSAPYVASIRHFTPKQRKMIQAEIRSYTKLEQLYLR